MTKEKIPIIDFKEWTEKNPQYLNKYVIEESPEVLPICIPSYNNRMTSPTLKNLEKDDNELNRKVYVYVNKSDLQNYREYSNSEKINIIEYSGKFGRPYIRNFIVENQYKVFGNKRIFLVDDDIEYLFYYYKRDKNYNSKIKVNLYQGCSIIENVIYNNSISKGITSKLLGRGWDLSPVIGLDTYCQFRNIERSPFDYNTFPNKFYYLNLEILNRIGINFEKSDLFPDDFDLNIQLYERGYYQPIITFMSLYYKNRSDVSSSTWGSREKRIEGVMRLYKKWGNLLRFERRTENHILGNSNKTYMTYPRDKNNKYVRKYYDDILESIIDKDYELFEKLVFSKPELVMNRKDIKLFI
jgi:hypothetical protein